MSDFLGSTWPSVIGSLCSRKARATKLAHSESPEAGAVRQSAVIFSIGIVPSIANIPASENYYVAGYMPVTGFTKRENILLPGSKGQHRCHLIAINARAMSRDSAIMLALTLAVYEIW